MARVRVRVGGAERRLHRGGHAEGHGLGHAQPQALLEAHVVVDVQQLARSEVEQDVVEVAVT